MLSRSSIQAPWNVLGEGHFCWQIPATGSAAALWFRISNSPTDIALSTASEFVSDFPLMQWDLAFTGAHVAGKRLCALLTNRRSVYSQRTGAGLKSEASTVIEMILSAYIAHGSQHVGHDAACVAVEAESASATTFTRVPRETEFCPTIKKEIWAKFRGDVQEILPLNNAVHMLAGKGNQRLAGEEDARPWFSRARWDVFSARHFCGKFG